MKSVWKYRITLLLGAIGLVAGTSLSAQAITTERVASGLNRPVFVTAPDGDDRLFIVEQTGVIKILKNGSVLATPFLDISHLITYDGGNDERGLLGLAFHPNYAVNGEFFVDYTNLSSDTVIARYLVSGNPDVADAGSAEVLLTVDQPNNNHNGGTLKFGPLDGYLYIGMGDGGGAGDQNNLAQNDGTLLGKMLRIDVDGAAPYVIPPDNPFVGAGLPLDEIWAKGFRNPYRWSFDRETGDLYIADVGQQLYEEIDFEPADSPGGLNYGWRLMEGEHCYDPPIDCDDGSLVLPIYEYTHGGNPFRCSITGGYVYRGLAIPSLQGTYFFADWCSDQIWSFRYDGETINEFTDRSSELDPGGGLAITNISSFGEDGFGELYIVDRGSGSNGEIYKIQPDPAGVSDSVTRRGFGLSPGRPNPFTDETRVDLQFERAGAYEAEILDVSGRRVRLLEDGRADAGRSSLAWDGRDDSGRSASAGVYFLRVRTAERSITRQVHLIR